MEGGGGYLFFERGAFTLILRWGMIAAMFKIAIVGRPNVGKSALFNRLTNKRKAIVEDFEGVTRDRIYDVCQVFGRWVTFIDTGGIDSSGGIDFSEEIRMQTMAGIREADALIFVVDGRCGPTLQDEEIANFLLKQKKPVYLAINKMDNENNPEAIAQFYSLGWGEVYPVSAMHGTGVADLIEKVIPSEIPCEKSEEKLPRVAIIGRPNVGKSTLLNYILQEERCVVSDIPGTTRDAIDVEVEGVIFIDTAGIRKKKAEDEAIDKFAAIRTEKTIERCDLCILVIDVQVGLTAFEKNILRMVEEKGKGCILFINKWDQMHDVRMEHVDQTIRASSPFIAHVPFIVGSAKTGRGVDKIFTAIFEVKENLERRVTTGELNTFLERSVQLNHPPMIQGRRLRIYYLTQTSASPPHFVLFVNKSELLVETYRRYLLNQMRSEFQFTGAPIRLKLKQKKERSTS